MFGLSFADPLREVGTSRPFPVSVVVSASTNAIDTANARRRREHIQIDPDLWRQICDSNSGTKLRNQIVLTMGGFSVPLSVIVLEPQTSITGVRIGVEALARFPGVSLPAAATISAYAPSTPVDDAAAQAAEQYYEFVDDDGSNTNTIVIAPHGGDIESNTDVMAAALKVALDAVGKTTTVWGGRGYHSTGGQDSYDAHHISTVDTDERLLPVLTTVFRSYSRGVSLHGQGASNRIDIGCPAAQNAFVDALVTSLQGDASLATQTIARSTDVVEIAGSDDHNLINRLSPTWAIQIEMGPECRDSSAMRGAVVSKVAAAMAPL